jgi:hypothetical protein
MAFEDKQDYLNKVREMADEDQSDTITEEEKQLLKDALKNLGMFIEENTALDYYVDTDE